MRNPFAKPSWSQRAKRPTVFVGGERVVAREPVGERVPSPAEEGKAIVRSLKRYVDARLTLLKFEFGQLAGQLQQVLILGVIALGAALLGILILEAGFVAGLAALFDWPVWLSAFVLAAAHLIAAALVGLQIKQRAQHIEPFAHSRQLAESQSSEAPAQGKASAAAAPVADAQAPAEPAVTAATSPDPAATSPTARTPQPEPPRTA